MYTLSLTGEGQLDIIDVLIKLVIFLSFIVFGICVWMIKKEKEKEKIRKSEIKDKTDTGTVTVDKESKANDGR